jgi:hypothetical protein
LALTFTGTLVFSLGISSSMEIGLGLLEPVLHLHSCMHGSNNY